MASSNHNTLQLAQDIVPLRTAELANGVFRHTDFLHALSRTPSLSYLHLDDAVIIFTGSEPRVVQRPTTIQTLQLQTSTADMETDMVAYLLDPRSAVDVSHVRGLRVLQHTAARTTTDAVALLVHAMRESLETLEMISPRLNNRGRLGWSPLTLAPHLVTLSFVFSRRAERRHAPEMLREAIKSVRCAVALERLHVELSLPRVRPTLQYLGDPEEEDDLDSREGQDTMWKAFEYTLIFVGERYMSSFRGVHIKVHGPGGDALRGLLSELGGKGLLSVTNV